MNSIPLKYFQTDDVLYLSPDLIGKFIFTRLENQLVGGMVVETEAYRAPDDKASHAYGLRRKKRNQVMYHQGGCVYVYICYGIYPLLNVVTNQHDIPHAILIRAIEPLTGIETMLKRRGKARVDRSVTAGPRILSIALEVNKSLSGVLLTGPEIWLEDRELKFSEEEILAGPRVGISYAQEHARLPWRFRIKNHPYTNPAK